MIQTIDIQNRGNAISLLALQAAAYLVEAEWLGFRKIPPLHDSIPSLQSSGETFLGYYNETETLLGAISFAINEQRMRICRMMVHPDHFRKGIASRLLGKVLGYPGSHEKFFVFTGTANTPAINLYEKHGFQPVQTNEIPPGISFTKLDRDRRFA